MQKLIVVVVSLAVFASACTSGDTENTTPASTTPADVDEANTDEADESENLTPQAVPDAVPGASGFDQLGDLAAGGATEVEVALAELSAHVGPLPGTEAVTLDTSLYPSLTGAISTLRDPNADLTEEQLVAVDETVERLFSPANMSATFDADDLIVAIDEDEGGGDTIDSSGAGGICPAGTPGADDRAGDLLTRWRSEFRQAASQLRRDFPGRLDYVVSIADPRVWDPETSGAGTLLAQGYDDGIEGQLTDCFGEHACYIMVGRTGATGALARSIATHELFHCWHFTELDFDNDGFRQTPIWVREGLAGWIGEHYSGGSFYGGEWWSRYFDGGPSPSDPGAAGGFYDLFFASYSAVGFWSHIDSGGRLISAIPDLVRRAASGDDRAIYADAIGISGNGAVVAAAATQRPDLGTRWTTSGAGMPPGHRGQPRESIEVGAGLLLETPPGTQVSNEIDFDVDGTIDHIVSTSIAGNGVFIWQDGIETTSTGEAIVETRCIGVECLCPDGTSVTATHPPTNGDEAELDVALSGGPFTDSVFQVIIESIEDHCDDEETEESNDEPEADSAGLIGDWRATPESLREMFTEVYDSPELPLDVTGVGGDLILKIGPGGSASLTYTDVTVFFGADSPIGEVTVNGGGTLSWAIAGGQLQFFGGAFSIVATTPALGEFPLELSDDDIAGGGTGSFRFVVDGAQLTLTDADGSRGGVFFPVAWTRE